MQSTAAHSQRKAFTISEIFTQAELKPADFEKIGAILYKVTGIRLSPGKEELVKSRLVKRLRSLGIPTFEAYLRYALEDKASQELNLMIDLLTTNKTSFFRESQHFDFMRARILPTLGVQSPVIRIWSAGCSSGEEPYSIAMFFSEEWPGVGFSRARILATDISARMLAKARAGEYDMEALQGLSPFHLAKYFDMIQTGTNRTYRVNAAIKQMVRFARLNLIDTWPMKGPFDLIFCRNVMIYFDRETQQDLVRRFYEILAPGGYLLIGHSESLVSAACGFKYVQPATYMK